MKFIKLGQVVDNYSDLKKQHGAVTLDYVELFEIDFFKLCLKNQKRKLNKQDKVELWSLVTTLNVATSL